MKFKLKYSFRDRMPLFILRRNNVIYFQMNINIAKADGNRYMFYYEYDKTDEHNIKEVGMLASKFLKRFEDVGDLSIAEFEELVGMEIEQYKASYDRDYYWEFMDAKDHKDLYKYYDRCSLDYDIYRKKYSFHIWGMNFKLCKCIFQPKFDHTKIAAKQGNAEERPDAGCGIKR